MEYKTHLEMGHAPGKLWATKNRGIRQMQHDTFILTHLAIIELNMAMQISLCSPHSSLGPLGLIPDFLQ